MKKGDDEEGEHLHSWIPEECIAAAYYYTKQLGGPTAPQIMISPVRGWLLTPTGSQYAACLQWCHWTNHSGKLSWNDLQRIISWGDSWGKIPAPRVGWWRLLWVLWKHYLWTACQNKWGFMMKLKWQCGNNATMPRGPSLGSWHICSGPSLIRFKHRLYIKDRQSPAAILVFWVRIRSE